ncbi:UTRA domain-containing protein [Lactobacillus sp. R2/2]|nr:UTRA domain-containing protein [Lactobacillus sp. R2/2]
MSAKQAQSSLYQYFEDDLGLEIDYATKTITVEPASQNVMQQLQLTDTNLVVVVRSLTYLKDTSFFNILFPNIGPTNLNLSTLHIEKHKMEDLYYEFS